MSNWFCPALLPTWDASQAIYAWAQQQDWPEGTELKRPDRYHTTLLYAPDVSDETRDEIMRNEFDLMAVGHWSHEAWTSRVLPFDPSGEGHRIPVVIELHSFWLTHRWNNRRIAKIGGLYDIDPAIHERYTPHITVATLPFGAEFTWMMPPHVNFLFEPDPVELRSYYKALRG